MSYEFEEIEESFSLFDFLDSLKYFDENGNEYWYARDLMSILDYKHYITLSRCLRKTVFTRLQEGLTPAFTSQHFQYAPDCNPNLEDNWKLTAYACYFLGDTLPPTYKHKINFKSYFLEKLEPENIAPQETRTKSSEKIQELLFPVANLCDRYGIGKQAEINRRNYLGMKPVQVKGTCFVTEQQLNILDSLDDWIVQEGGKMEDFDPNSPNVRSSHQSVSADADADANSDDLDSIFGEFRNQIKDRVKKLIAQEFDRQLNQEISRLFDRHQNT